MSTACRPSPSWAAARGAACSRRSRRGRGHDVALWETDRAAAGAALARDRTSPHRSPGFACRTRSRCRATSPARSRGATWWCSRCRRRSWPPRCVRDGARRRARRRAQPLQSSSARRRASSPARAPTMAEVIAAQPAAARAVGVLSGPSFAAEIAARAAGGAGRGVDRRGRRRRAVQELLSAAIASASTPATTSPACAWAAR